MFMAGSVGGHQKVTNTYTTAQTVNGIPIGAQVSISGHGGDRSQSQTGWSLTSAPTGIQFVSPGTGTYLTVPATLSGHPSSVDLSATGLSGTSVSVSWSGGTGNDDNGTSCSWNSGSGSYTINTVSSPAGDPANGFLGSSTGWIGGGVPFTLAVTAPSSTTVNAAQPNGAHTYTTVLNSWFAGSDATVTPSGMSAQTYRGQKADASYFSDQNNFVATGTSIVLNTMPTGSSITITWQT